MSQYPDHRSRDENTSDPYGSSSPSSSSSASSYGTSEPYGTPDSYGGQYGTSDPYGTQYGAPYGTQGQYGGQYGQAGYGAQAEHPRATAVLVLGILGLFFAPLGIIGFFLGQGARKEIRNGAPYQWGGSLKIGWIISLVVTILFVIGLVLTLLVLVFGGALIANDPAMSAAALTLT